MRLQKYWPVRLVPEASVSALLAVRPFHAFRMVRLGPVPLRVPKTPPIRSPSAIQHPASWRSLAMCTPLPDGSQRARKPLEKFTEIARKPSGPSGFGLNRGVGAVAQP